MDSTSSNMDLIPSLSFFQALAAIPLVMTLVPIVLSALFKFVEHPFVKPIINTTLVVLKNTEVVWRPAINFAIMLSKPILKAIALILPIVKSIVVYVVNVTVSAFRTAQSMGMSMANTFPVVAQGLKDIGESLVVLARGLGKLSYYVLRGVSLIVGSVESVFVFFKRVLFEAHLLTMADVYAVMMPFAIVLSLVAVLYWFRKSPSQPCNQTFQPRRSARIARKRAMLCSADLSDAFLPSKKSSATSTNL